MLDKLDEQYKKNNKNNSIFENKNLKWFDPANGMGNYPVVIYLKLMEGLKKEIPNDKKRKYHILENMIYMSEKNKKNCYISKQIFDINNEFKLNINEGDSLELDIFKKFNVKKFDIIIGNPPYNKEFKGKNGYASPIFHEFIEKYIDKCDYLTFIVPSRWFSGGRGFDIFRKKMLNRKDIVYIKHFKNSREIFKSNVDIEGGVNYFLKDVNHNGKCNFNNTEINLNDTDMIIDSKFINIINKFLEFNSLISNYNSKGYYKIPLTDKRLHDNKNNKDTICYVSQQKGFIKYIDMNTLEKDKIETWKIITPTANGKNGCFGNIFIGKPTEVHSESYISFNVKNEKEAESLLSYLKCRLPNFALSLRKITQNISSDTCKWIPLPPLNKIWNDEEVYKYFKLSTNDIKLIDETNIIGFDKKSIKKSISKIEKEDSESDKEEKPKISKIKKNKSTINKI